MVFGRLFKGFGGYYTGATALRQGQWVTSSLGCAQGRVWSFDRLRMSGEGVGGGGGVSFLWRGLLVEGGGGAALGEVWGSRFLFMSGPPPSRGWGQLRCGRFCRVGLWGRGLVGRWVVWRLGGAALREVWGSRFLLMSGPPPSRGWEWGRGLGGGGKGLGNPKHIRAPSLVPAFVRVGEW